MRSFYSTLSACALVLLAGLSSFAQLSSDEKRLSDAAAGFSFAVPAGFASQQNAEGFALVNGAKTIIVAIKGHNYETFAKFMSEANLEANGFIPLGEIQNVGERGKTFRVYKQTPQGNLIVDTCVMFSPYGGGMFISAITNDANQEASFQTSVKIANSVRFMKPDVSEVNNEWQALLRGRHLIFLYTASGFAERKDINLCPSGRFTYNSESSSASNIGSGFVTSKLEGRWNVSARGGVPTLTLQATDGTVLEYKISRQQGSSYIYLNGKKYISEALQGCP